MRLVFVTGNPGKFREAAHELDGIATLEQDTDGYDEIQADTLREVALNGLGQVGHRLDPPFFLEDAGLFVTSLAGFPGVYSAYVYKTLGCEGVLRLLFDHRTQESRRAHFEAVIAYRDANGHDHVFTGQAKGTMSTDMVGDEGFGFDPVFIPLGKKETFAQLGLDAKGKISHRGKALAAFRRHLEQYPLPSDEATVDPGAPDPTNQDPSNKATKKTNTTDQAGKKSNATHTGRKKTNAANPGGKKTPPNNTGQASESKAGATRTKTATTDATTTKGARNRKTSPPTKTNAPPNERAPSKPTPGPRPEPDDGPTRTPDGIVTVLDDDES